MLCQPFIHSFIQYLWLTVLGTIEASKITDLFAMMESDSFQGGNNKKYTSNQENVGLLVISSTEANKVQLVSLRAERLQEALSYFV